MFGNNAFEYYRDYFTEMLISKVIDLFKIKTDVDDEYLLRELIVRGQVCVAKIDGRLYALNGALGGKPNQYYRPYFWIGANPILGSYQLRVNDVDEDRNEAVVVYLTEASRTTAYSLLPLIKSTAELLTDNLISLNVNQINGRAVSLITADTPELRKGAEFSLKEIYSGNPFVVFEQDLLSSIQVNPVDIRGVSESIATLTELNQFIMANFYKQIGIKANGVMKRERLITDEINEQNVFIQANYDSMFESIKKCFEQINEKFEEAEWTIEKPEFLNSEVELPTETESSSETESSEESLKSLEDSEPESTLYMEGEEEPTAGNDSEPETEEPQEDNDTLDEEEIVEKAEEIIDQITEIVEELVEPSEEQEEEVDEEDVHEEN